MAVPTLLVDCGYSLSLKSQKDGTGVCVFLLTSLGRSLSRLVCARKNSHFTASASFHHHVNRENEFGEKKKKPDENLARCSPLQTATLFVSRSGGLLHLSSFFSKKTQTTTLPSNKALDMVKSNHQSCLFFLLCVIVQSFRSVVCVEDIF